MCVAASYLAARLFIMAACKVLEDVVHYGRRDATARRGNDHRFEQSKAYSFNCYFFATKHELVVPL